MEAFFAVLALTLLAMPVVALVLSVLALRRAQRSEELWRGLQRELDLLRRELRRPPAAAIEEPAPVVAVPQPVPGVSPEEPLAPAASAEPSLPPQPVEIPAAPVQPPTTVEPLKPAVEPPAAPPEAPPPRASLEERIGILWFTRIGAVVLVLAAAYFFKYAVDNRWIGPWGRVSLGLLAGVAVLGLAEWMAPKLRTPYRTGLLGVGTALLYVSSYAAYGFYRLLPLVAAFVALVVVAALAGALAVRQKAPVVLMMAVLAAAANPLLLSTGEDRPLALFSYLLLVSLSALTASFRLRSPVAVWLTVATVVVLGIAWHGEFFKVAPPALDQLTSEPVPGSAGPYFPLAARVVPLLFVAAFAALWVACARLARARGFVSVGPAALQMTALLFAHVAAGALLIDRPELVTAAMAIAGAASVLLLRREEEVPLLALPLAASFLLLAASSEQARERPLATLLLAGAWMAAYAIRLATRAVRREPAEPSAAPLVLAAAGVLAVILSALLLAPTHPTTLALSLGVLAVGFVLVGAMGGRTWVPAVGVVAALVALLAATPHAAEKPDITFLVLSALWGLVYLAGGVHALLRQRVAGPLPVQTAVSGPLGFVAVALLHTRAEDGALRAVLCAAAGVAVFLVGVAVRRDRQLARSSVSGLLGVGVALTALAVGLAFAGVTITLVWAIMAAAAAYLAAREEEPQWAWGALALFVPVLVRVLVVDLPLPVHEHMRFMATAGAEGALHPTPFLNSRALALAGAALALLLSARAFSRRPSPPYPAMASGLVVAGHALLLTLVVAETVQAVTTFPPLPGAGLAGDEFSRFAESVYTSLAAQSNTRAVTATLAMGGFGALLLGLGFAARSVLHRWLGLLVLAATLCKLALSDIWRLPRLSQVLVLGGVGVLLLGAGFLYARFGSRLLGLLKGGTVALLLLLLAAPAEALESRRFRQTGSVVVPAPGLCSFAVTPDLYRASAAGPGLSDVRLLAADGAEVPWVLRDVAPARAASELEATLLDPVVLADGSSQATFDLGPGGARHSEVRLRLAPEVELLRRCRVEVSDDRHSWGLIGGGVVVRAATAQGLVESSDLHYPVSAARFVRVTIAAAAGGPAVEVMGGTVILRPPEATEPTALLPLAITRRGRTEQRQSFVELDAGGSGVPLHALRLEVTGSVFERRVRVEATDHPGYWAGVGCGVVYRVAEGESLVVPAADSRRYWRLVFDDGDDPPLDVAAVRGEYREQEVVLRAPSAGSVTVLAGCRNLSLPRYDLGAVLARSQAGAPLRLAPPRLAANPGFDDSDQVLPPWSERARVPIGIGVGVLLLLLGWWTVRLLRQPES